MVGRLHIQNRQGRELEPSGEADVTPLKLVLCDGRLIGASVIATPSSSVRWMSLWLSMEVRHPLLKAVYKLLVHYQ